MAKLDEGGHERRWRARWTWLPAYLAGLALATAAELAVGLLLYSALGFLRALTLVLTVQAAAFALGLWSAHAGPPPSAAQVRRSWATTLAAFVAAAVFAFVWGVMETPSRPLMQAVGLAVLGGFPPFTVASLFGAMVRQDGVATTRNGMAGAFGAATGFLVTGLVFVPVLEPHSILLVCVIGLSVGALFHGWLTREVESRSLLESRWTPRGELRVEDRVGGVPTRRRRVLLEAGRIRGVEGENGEDTRPWERQVVEGLQGGPDGPLRVLLFGVGAGTLVRRLLAEVPAIRLEAIEPSAEVWRLARAHFPPGRLPDEEPWRALDVRVGLHLDALGNGQRIERGADLVVVDLAALPATGDVPPVRPDLLAGLLRLLAPGGVVLLGPVANRSAERPGLDAWASDACSVGTLTLHVRDGEGLLALRPSSTSHIWEGGAPVRTWSSTSSLDTSAP